MWAPWMLAMGLGRTRLTRASGLDLPSRYFLALSGSCPSWGAAGHHQAWLQLEMLTWSPSRSPRAAGAPPAGGQRGRRLKPAGGFQPSRFWEPPCLLSYHSGLTSGCTSKLRFPWV